MLADRIAKNARHLRKWGRRQGFSCLRLYDHDIPEFPVSLDDYEGHVLVTLSAAAQERCHREELQAEVRLALPELHELVLKERASADGGGVDLRRAFVVQEQGMSFEVNLHGYQDTGLFLDHRLGRAWVRAQASGLRVLNLFCYTGSFSVAAGLGGARSVTSVDLSRTYLDWTRRNLALNSQQPAVHRLLAADVLQWLEQALREQERYDLIVCDPPTFSNSKRMRQVFDVQSAHRGMLDGLWQLLAPGGRLFFSCNDRRFRMESELPFQEISARTRSEDFRRSGGQRSWLGIRDQTAS